MRRPTRVTRPFPLSPRLPQPYLLNRLSFLFLAHARFTVPPNASTSRAWGLGCANLTDQKPPLLPLSRWGLPDGQQNYRIRTTAGRGAYLASDRRQSGGGSSQQQHFFLHAAIALFPAARVLSVNSLVRCHTAVACMRLPA